MIVNVEKCEVDNHTSNENDNLLGTNQMSQTLSERVRSEMDKYGIGNHGPDEHENPYEAYQMSQTLVAPHEQRIRWHNFLCDARNEGKYRELMNAEELEAYNNLPMAFTAYRGIRSSSPIDDVGFSWSLSIEVAQWFADNRGDPNEPPVVLKKIISKCDVVWVLLERDEQEIVIAPDFFMFE